MMLSVYERVMGERFSALPLPVQQFHRLTHARLDGWVIAEAPTTRVAKLLALLLGTQTVATEGPLQFELHAQHGVETWTRRFPSKTLASTLSADGHHLVECMGASRLIFELQASGDKLVMHLKAMRFCGIPCPGWLLPAVVAEERGINGQFHFTVKALLPLIGQVAAYRGHLFIAEEQRP
jgi:Domain of unknown function (DUF4166)